MSLLRTPALYALEAQALTQEGPGVLMQRAASALACHAARMLRALPASAAPHGLGSHESAGRCTTEAATQEQIPPSVQVWIGPGNNGGDALLAGLMLADQGYRVIAVDFFPRANRPADAAAVFRKALMHGAAQTQVHDPADTRMQIQGSDPAHAPCASLTWWQAAQAIDALKAAEGAWLILDGLFGIGLKRPMQSPLTDLVLAANARNPQRIRVLAVDIPSGLNADTGMPISDTVVRADITLTFLADKPGLHTGQAAQWCGEVFVDLLGCQRSGGDPLDDSPTAPVIQMRGVLFTEREARTLIPRRSGDAHKGRFGDLLVIEGAPATQGAAMLALLGAQAVGAGRLYLGRNQAQDQSLGQGRNPSHEATQPQPSRGGPASALHPEFMARQLKPADPGPADAVVIGCGLGQDARARSLLRDILSLPIPCVLDADALNLIAGDPAFKALLGSETPRVMTPHPLEAARLLDCGVPQVQADRISTALQLARRYRAVIVLKGAGSVVADPQGSWSINASGGPLLAVAGTGDVLAGMIGGLMAQGLTPESAARLGTWLHGAAADAMSSALAWSAGIGLPASRLPEAVRERINALAGVSY